MTKTGIHVRRTSARAFNIFMGALNASYTHSTVVLSLVPRRCGGAWYRLFAHAWLPHDLWGSGFVRVPVAQSDGLSQSICRTWRIADICSSLSVKRPSPTLCSASVSPWSKLETHSIVRATLYAGVCT